MLSRPYRVLVLAMTATALALGGAPVSPAQAVGTYGQSVHGWSVQWGTVKTGQVAAFHSAYGNAVVVGTNVVPLPSAQHLEAFVEAMNALEAAFPNQKLSDLANAAIGIVTGNTGLAYGSLPLPEMDLAVHEVWGNLHGDPRFAGIIGAAPLVPVAGSDVPAGTTIDVAAELDGVWTETKPLDPLFDEMGLPPAGVAVPVEPNPPLKPVNPGPAQGGTQFRPMRPLEVLTRRPIGLDAASGACAYHGGCPDGWYPGADVDPGLAFGTAGGAIGAAVGTVLGAGGLGAPGTALPTGLVPAGALYDVGPPHFDWSGNPTGEPDDENSQPEGCASDMICPGDSDYPADSPSERPDEDDDGGCIGAAECGAVGGGGSIIQIGESGCGLLANCEIDRTGATHDTPTGTGTPVMPDAPH